MGANLSFQRPKCRYPDPLNKKNQVGPMIVNDPYKNKRGQVGLNINTSNPSSFLGPMVQQLQSNPGFSSMSPQGFQTNPLSSMFKQGLQSNPALGSMFQQGLQSSPQLTGILSGLSQKSPRELEKLSRSFVPNLQGMNSNQLSGLMSMASPYLSKLTPAQNRGLSNGLGMNSGESVPPPIPSTPPPTLPNENVSTVEGGSKEKNVKELRKICKRHKIQITKDGKYLTKKELLKIIKKKKLF
jgi:hypothetical protein